MHEFQLKLFLLLCIAAPHAVLTLCNLLQNLCSILPFLTRFAASLLINKCLVLSNHLISLHFQRMYFIQLIAKIYQLVYFFLRGVRLNSGTFSVAITLACGLNMVTLLHLILGHHRVLTKTAIIKAFSSIIGSYLVIVSVNYVIYKVYTDFLLCSFMLGISSNRIVLKSNFDFLSRRIFLLNASMLLVLEHNRHSFSDIAKR